MSQNETNADKMLKYLPVIGGLLIFYGFIKLHIFYQFFGIQIIEYLEFGEILTSFIDDIWALLVIIFVWLLFQGVFSLIIHFYPRNPDSDTVYDIPQNENIDSEKFGPIQKPIEQSRLIEIAEMADHSKKEIGFVALFFLAVSIIFHCFFYLFGWHNSGIYYTMIIISLITCFIPLLLTSDSRLSNLLLLVLSQLFTTCFILNKSNREAYSKVEEPITVKLEIEGDDSLTVFNSNCDTIYLGKTNQYYYFHIQSNDGNIIIPTSEVKQFEVIPYKEFEEVDTNKTKICLYPL